MDGSTNIETQQETITLSDDIQKEENIQIANNRTDQRCQWLLCPKILSDTSEGIEHIQTEHAEAFVHKDRLLIDLNHTIYVTTGQTIPTKPIPPYFLQTGQLPWEEIKQTPAKFETPRYTPQKQVHEKPDSDEIFDEIVETKPPMTIKNCQYCTDQFDTQAEYKAHLKSAHYDRVYTCILCQKQYNGITRASRHIERQHKSLIKNSKMTEFLKPVDDGRNNWIQYNN